MTERLVLLTKPRCPACDEARAVLQGLGEPFGERDATADEADYRAYGDRLPVLLLDGREHSFWSIDVPRLRRDLGA